MLTITITFQAPDSLIANYTSFPEKFPFMHLYALGQALLDDDVHAHRYREKDIMTKPVIVAEFPDTENAGLTWWWSGLMHPREQIRAFGAYLMAEASNQFMFVMLQQRAILQQAQTKETTLFVPGRMNYPGQNNPLRQ